MSPGTSGGGGQLHPMIPRNTIQVSVKFCAISSVKKHEISFHFNSLTDGCPSAGADLEGVLHVKILIKNLQSMTQEIV